MNLRNALIRAEIVSLAVSGYRPRLIYEQIGGAISLGQICNILVEARKCDADIPRFVGGRLPGSQYHLPRRTTRRRILVDS